MRAITVETLIDASADRVWEIFRDLERWSEWNPFIVEAEGALALGKTLRLTVAQPGRRPRTLRPIVTAFDPGRRVEWLGRFFGPGLFDGRHSFTFTAVGDRTEVVQSESFSGLLVPFTTGVVDATTQQFTALNEALARRASATN